MAAAGSALDGFLGIVFWLHVFWPKKALQDTTTWAGDFWPGHGMAVHIRCLTICLAWHMYQLFHCSFTGFAAGPSGPSRRLSVAGGSARQLTSQIKKTHSSKELIDVLKGAIDEKVFNFYHASAAYTQLVTLKKRNNLQAMVWDDSTLLGLHTRVQGMIAQNLLNEQALTNILWSIAHLAEGSSISTLTELLLVLLESVSTKVKGMNPQGVSNSLWALARLRGVSPSVMKVLPKIASEIPDKAKGMKPQELSTCFWAFVQLKDCLPGVTIEALPAISMQIPDKAKGMTTLGLSTCLCALGDLKDLAPDVLHAVPSIVSQIPNKANSMDPQGLSNCLQACLKLKDDAPKVLEIVLALVGEIPPKMRNFTAKDLSDSLTALLLLSDSVPEVEAFLAAGGRMDEIVRSAATRLNTLIPAFNEKDLGISGPAIVWACAKVQVYDHQMLLLMAKSFRTPNKQFLPNFSLCALLWSYQRLAADDFADFRKRLMLEIGKRGFSDADVESTQLGVLKWNHAKVE